MNENIAEINRQVTLWDNSTTTPPWMMEYFRWHHETKRNLNVGNWDRTKYLVMHCLERHTRCGGLSDRLRPLPVLILIAARSQRLLLIQWTRPFPLEEFLVPPVGGIDWRAPAWLTRKFESEASPGKLKEVVRVAMTAALIVKTKVQSSDHGAKYYNNQTEADSATFDEVQRDIFQVFFEPSRAVARQLDANMKELGLIPGQYAAAHFRALYGRDSRPPGEMKAVSVNAVNCASELRPGGKVFFAADNKLAVEFVNEYAEMNSFPIVTLAHSDEPLHLDKALNWTLRSPADYYATFVDLLILSRSRCVTYSNGGFGTFGLLLSYNISCSVRHFAKKILQVCPKWMAAK